MSRRVLIVGAGGMVGRAWQELLTGEDVAYDAWTRQDFDLSADDCKDRLLAQAGGAAPGRWNLIVNCGAYTQVDKAEQDYAAAERINGRGATELAAAAKALGARLVHYSTDYVFDGQATAPYPVDAPTNPVNAYGRSKLAGERAVLESGADALLVRTSWVYAPWGKNFVSTMVRLMRERPELSVVSDQLGRPSSAQQLARRTWGLCQQGCSGTFHLTDGGQCSWAEFAVAIAKKLGAPTRVRPISTKDYPTPAVRPAYSVLDTSKADALLGAPLAWQDALAQVLDAMTRAHSEGNSNG